MEILERLKSLIENPTTEDIEKLEELSREVQDYCNEYGVSVSNITVYDTCLVFIISVPMKSDINSDRGFEMAGIYLANTFKTHICEVLNRLEIKEFSKLRVKINYTINNKLNWSKENSIESNNDDTNNKEAL